MLKMGNSLKIGLHFDLIALRWCTNFGQNM